MARRFKEARVNSNIKLTDAAKLFDVAQPTVSAWEGERKEPSFATVKKMAELYHVSVDYLLGYDSFELLSVKERIPKESVPLFHAKPVWVPEKGWALVNTQENILVYADETHEKIGDDTELYFAPPPYAEKIPPTAEPLLLSAICEHETVWVEPISSDMKLREILRGQYAVKDEYVENSRGSRFHFDSYGVMWLAYSVID